MFVMLISGLLDILIPIIIFILIVLAIIALATGTGWVLQLFLPFSLFEATLLALIAELATGFFTLYRIPLGHDVVGDEGEDKYGSPFLDYDDEEDEDEYTIPAERFWAPLKHPTWEELLRYVLANSFYEDMLIDMDFTRRWDEKELGEVAIDLADVAIWGVKRLPPRKKISLSKSKLREGLKTKERWIEYQPFIDLFYPIVNINLNVWSEPIRDIKNERLWQDPADTSLI